MSEYESFQTQVASFRTWTWSPGGSTIPTIKMSQDLGRMPGGGSGARLIVDGDGTRWVMKSHILGGHPHRYLCLNEGLCAQVGYRLGVKVPEVCAVELTAAQLQTFNAGAVETDSILVASRLIEPAEALTPASASELAPEDLAGIYTLDTLVWNTDRKEEHILVQETDDGWDAYAIDHGNALAVGDSLSGSLDPTQQALPPFPLVQPLITSRHLEPWVERAQEISRKEFADMVHSLPPWWVIEPDAVDTLADALHARARELKSAMTQHFS